MKKSINEPQQFVDQMLDGILKAYPNQLKATSDPRAIVRADSPKNVKVSGNLMDS